MSRFNSPSHQPRRGQALLLAVLIMIFAALLSASFIAIVSVNLNQTARQTDKNRAIVSAQAGMDFVKKQLAYSDDGERWRPQRIAPTDAQAGIYYTSLDRAQGWSADTDGDGLSDYAKYPDPRTDAGISSGPQFLTRVQSVPTNIAPSNPEFDKAGATKITVIGLSPEDPSAYSRTIAYFGGYKNSPLAQTMRMVSNTDFRNNTVPTAQVDSYDAATLTITLKNINGAFPLTDNAITATPATNPNPAFSVMIGNPGAPVRSETVVVSTASTLTLASAPVNVLTSNERVELSANFGAPALIDYNNDGTLAATETADFKTSDPTYNLASLTPVPTPQPGGVRVNGGLAWTGNVAAEAIGGTKNAFSAGNPIPAAFQSSGLMTITGTTSLSGSGFTGTGQAAMVDSSNASFPGTGGIWPVSATDKDYLVSDGANRIRGVTSGTRSVVPFKPPVFDSGEGLERYRRLTRFSKPYDDGNMMTATLPASASLYGSGSGIYIDNINDREKIGTGVDTTRDMTQSELVKMWLSATGGVDSYTRVPTTIESEISTSKSLEEQHLRGWISPNEFRARGVGIELTRDWDLNTTGDQPGVFITRDPRSENTTAKFASNIPAALGPDPNNTWKDERTGIASPGLYRKGFPWPTNGVIFAEGNINIKGQALNAPRSLTVISMNNIYIEDSISADADSDGILTTGAPRKIFLGAKKNVVMNPTRALSRPDAQTLSTNTANIAIAVGNNVDVPVNDVGDFRIGDLIETSTSVGNVDTVSGVGQVTAITATPSLQVTVTQATSALILPKSFVRTSKERQSNIASLVSPTPYGIIGGTTDAIQRRFTVPLIPTPISSLRLAFNQSADRVTAATISTKDFDGTTQKPTTGIVLTNKRVLDAGATNFDPTATNNKRVNKVARVDSTVPTLPGAESFPGAAASFAVETEAQGSGLSGSTTPLFLKEEMESVTTHNDQNVPTGWKYNVNVAAGYEKTPFFYLAGIGNRYDYGVKPTLPAPVAGAGLTGWQANIANSDIAPINSKYEVPMTTSIGFWLNNSSVTVLPATPSIMTNEHWNGTTYDQTPSFGFAPNFLDSAIASEGEDILTTDQGFYQTAAIGDPVKSTLDTRSFGNLPVGENWFTLRQNSLPSTIVPTPTLPNYRILNMKLEDVTLIPSTSNISAIKPGHTFAVNAFVYAQTGSWFVIPGASFEPRLHGDATQAYFDVNNNSAPDPGEYLDIANDGYNAGDFPDFNRNGVLDDADKFAAARYLRPNYQINFTGAIAENQTALVNDVGTTRGSVASWMDKWATTSLATGGGSPVLTNDRIHYVFDPTVVLNSFESTDTGFKLPQVPEVFNVS